MTTKSLLSIAFACYCAPVSVNHVLALGASTTATQQLESKNNEILRTEQFRSASREMGLKSDELTSRVLVAKSDAELNAILFDLKARGVPTTFVGNLWSKLSDNSDCKWISARPDLSGQDPSFVGGRCLWVLEKALNQKFPKLSKDSTDEERDRLGYKISCAVEDAKTIAKGKSPADVSRLSKDEKLNQAKSSSSPKAILRRLSWDSDVNVRRLVAQNKNVDVLDLVQLNRWDEDPTVRKLAAENLYTARNVAVGDFKEDRTILYLPFLGKLDEEK